MSFLANDEFCLWPYYNSNCSSSQAKQFPSKHQNNTSLSQDLCPRSLRDCVERGLAHYAVRHLPQD